LGGGEEKGREVACTSYFDRGEGTGREGDICSSLRNERRVYQ